jgi:hypothetical protein
MRHIISFLHIPDRPADAIGGAGDSFPGGHSGREPPNPIPNSEVKTLCADGSLAVGQVRVGHCQDPIRTPDGNVGGFSLRQSAKAEFVTPRGYSLRDRQSGPICLPASS